MCEKRENIPVYSYEKVTQRRKISPLHYHDDYELYFLIKGNTKYFIGNEMFHLYKNDFVFVPKKTFHKTDSEECLYNERILITFDDSVFTTEMLPVLEELTNDKFIRIPENKLSVVKELFLQIETENKENRKYKKLVIENYIKQLLIMILRLRSNEPRFISESDEFIYKIADYITNKFNEDLTLSSISRKFALSDEHLSRKFKSTIGIGINEYIRYIRITKAEKMLRETDYPITKIAQKCGFNDSNYFSTVFKNVIGITPLKYRKKRR